MEAIEMLKNRRSIRKYTDEIVSNEVLESIVEVAKFAPSWANSQTARYTFVTDENIIKKIKDDGVKGFAYNMQTLEHTKQVAVLSYVKGKSGKLKGDEYATNKGSEWEMFDAGIACQTFCLAAFEKGVGTCIFGVIDDQVIAKLINLPKEETVAAIITYGYINENGKNPIRHETKDIMRII